MPASLGEDWLSTKAATEYLGITPRTLYRLIDEGHLPGYRIGRVIRLRRAEVDEFIERCRIEPGDLRHLYPPVGQDDEGEGTRRPPRSDEPPVAASGGRSLGETRSPGAMA